MNRYRTFSKYLAAVFALAFFSRATAMQPRVSFQERAEIQSMIRSLDASDESAFLTSSRALREKGGKAVPFLTAALAANPNPRIRYQVARVLGEIEDERGVDALFQASELDPDDTVRTVARASLDVLIENLNAPELGDRVTRDYRWFDRQSIFSLRKRLKGDRLPSVRQRAAKALGEYGDERDLEILLDVAKEDTVAAVRLEAVKAIVRIAYPIVLSGEYRVTFYGTLAEGPDSFREKMVQSLIGLVEGEPDASVRLQIVKGLTRLVFPTFLVGEEGFGPLLSLKVRSREVILRVRNCLLSLLRGDRDARVRNEAVISLSKLFTALFDRGERIVNEELRRNLLGEKRAYYFYPYIPGRVSRIYRRTFRYLPSRAEGLLKPIRNGLSEAYSGDPDPGVRREAVVGLSLLGEKSDSRVILRHLRRERNEDVWLASVSALGMLGGESAAEALANVYRKTSNSARLRKAAVLAIGEIGTRKVLRSLASSIARERNPEVKLALLESLGHQQDEQTAVYLARACRDKDPELRAAAVRAAGHNFTDETISLLKTLLKGDPDEFVRAAACTSLSRALRKDASDSLIAALRDPGPAVRKAAAVELGIHGTAGAVDLLADLLRNDLDEMVRAEAATSLGSIGGPRSVRPLVFAVGHDYSDFVRERAIQALLKTDEPRAAIVAIHSVLPGLATKDPQAHLELGYVIPYLTREAHGQAVGER